MRVLTDTNTRLEGLDVARFLALLGMVIVNFDTVMVSGDHLGENYAGIAQMLQGRAAATFVVLAGIGLGLSASHQAWERTLAITLKRAAFLLFVGLLNLQIFDADIIHYYAFYFLLGTFFLRLRSKFLFFAMAGLVIGFVVLALFLEYDAGWNWQTYAYSDFWTVTGFTRNLFFNGWHPLVPWFAFFLLGIYLSRLRLRERTVQWQLLIGGSLLFIVVSLASRALVSMVADIDAEAVVLFATDPIPPMPLYMLAGGSVASATIGLCLLVESWLRSSGLLRIFTAPGRQTLTLYVAHIVIGMGTLEALGMLGGQIPQTALVAASLFIAIATVYALVWRLFYRRGPLEMLMRKMSEHHPAKAGVSFL